MKSFEQNVKKQDFRADWTPSSLLIRQGGGGMKMYNNLEGKKKQERLILIKELHVLAVILTWILILFVGELIFRHSLSGWFSTGSPQGFVSHTDDCQTCYEDRYVLKFADGSLMV